MSTGAYIDVRDLDTRSRDATYTTFTINAEMRAVQGATSMSTGAYINVRDRNKAERNAEMRRLYDERGVPETKKAIFVFYGIFINA